MSKDYVMQLEATIENLRRDNQLLKTKAQKEHKALEIIKKKNVNIKLLKASSTVEQYNDELIRVLGRWFAEREFLTLEEFNLLKEVLE